MAKRISKRCSERRKTKTAITNARKEAKMKRNLNKKRKNAIKVPMSVLTTDEEKLHLKNIKDASKLRNTAVSSDANKEPKHIEKLRECISDSECFLEVVDFRDIEGTRNPDMENVLMSENVKVHVFLNYFDPGLEFSPSGLEEFEIIRDFAQLSKFNKICIFGTTKAGKFLASKNIELACGEKEFKIIKAPLINKGIYEVFRGAVDLKNINPVEMFSSIWNCLDSKKLMDYFRLSTFSDSLEFLALLSEKLTTESTKANTPKNAALFFFNCVKAGQIKWFRDQERLSFVFEI